MDQQNFNFNRSDFQALAPVQQRIIRQVDQNPPNYEQQEIIIRFHDQATGADIDAFLFTYHLQLKEQLQNQLYLVYDLAKRPITELLLQLGHAPLVAYVEPNYTVELDQIPSEPDFPRQWGLLNTGQNGGTPGIDINISPAWALTKGSPDIIVAVLDTGLDIANIEFQGRVVDFANFVNNNPNDTGGGHGTHVTGIIAAAENQFGMMGTAPNVKIMPIMISGVGGSVAGIIQGINYAIEKGAHVMNMSFGIAGHVESLRETLANSPILTCCSSGNTGTNNDFVLRSPASFNLDNQITVTNITAQGELFTSNPGNPINTSSNIGLQTVDLAAPGTQIFSTISATGFSYQTGTSMAAPFVTGVAALALSLKPDLSPSELKTIICEEVTKLPTLTGVIRTGGMINAGKVIQRVAALLESTGPDQGIATPTRLRITMKSETSLALAWDGVQNAVDGYDVFRDGVKIATVPTGVYTYTDSNLTPGTSYTYTVRAHAISEHSNLASGTTLSTTPPVNSELNPPLNFRITGKADTSITLAWDAGINSTAVNGYDIFRNGSQIATVPADVYTYTDTGLMPNTTYTYTVRVHAWTRHSNTSNGTTAASHQNN